ncbi:MAG: hypothetical protein H7Y19_13430, partial [Luteimonas sp.]|nr:hypothetical protein [Luteimonas sp.]
PIRFEQGHFCRNGAIDPSKTAAGKQAAALGWLVTSEQQAAGYTAIGVFSRGSQGTSGTCFIADGNIVIYRDARPVAIVYGDVPVDDEGGSIGGVVATLTAGRLRISDWTPVGSESADITLAPDRIDVVAIAEKETACGDITVPNIRGKSIPQARTLLAPFGWRPAVFGDAASKDNPYDAARDYRNEGLTEFETCSGTGYGFCSVRYDHRSGAVLGVTTVGDGTPTVSGVSVTCPKARRS